MPASRRSRTDLAARLTAAPGALAPDAAGPVEVLARASTDGGERCEIAAQRLVAVDPESSGLRDLYVAVPVSGSVELRADGGIARAVLAEPDAEAVREARAFACGLVEAGSVRGVEPEAAGARARRRGRPTHEVVTDAHGRRVIRRIGFAGGRARGARQPR
jgi:hypothetical protein